MKKILVVGAGRSAISLISYLAEKSKIYKWKITVADQSLKIVKEKTKKYPGVKAISFDVNNSLQRKKEISKSDIVVSLVPPALHVKLIKDCLENRVHLITASYVSDEMKKYHKEAFAAGIVFLNEMGLDPGIDHMDTMRLLSSIKRNGGKVYSLKSFCGGLITPESDNNPWGYKVTWSPMNIVRAGFTGARYVRAGKIKIIPYNRIFLETQIVNVPGLGKYESYPNRDSIKYKELYRVPLLPNIYRGSLRKIGFCKAWNALVKLGLTDDTYIVPNSKNITYREWLSSYLEINNGLTTEKALSKFLGIKSQSEIFSKLNWLGLLSKNQINIEDATPAEILLNLISQKWKFTKSDRDMIILHTEIEYEIKRKKEKIVSSLVVKGDNYYHTAMSRTVGLPLGIGVNLILNNKINERGVIIPIYKDIYEPALKELSKLGLQFNVNVSALN